MCLAPPRAGSFLSGVWWLIWSNKSIPKSSHFHPSIPQSSHSHPTCIPLHHTLIPLSSHISTSMEHKGIYTAVQADAGWRVLFLEADQINPKEIPHDFPSEEECKRIANEQAPHLTFATNKAFKMAWDAQKLIKQLNPHTS